MANVVQPKMKTFEVGFKEYYYELSDWTSENIKARDEQDALRRFAKRHGLERTTDPTTWTWCEGDWHFTFRYIKPVTIKDCPHCKGSGQVSVYPREGILVSKKQS